jgi:hypothetical protein
MLAPFARVGHLIALKVRINTNLDSLHPSIYSCREINFPIYRSQTSSFYTSFGVGGKSWQSVCIPIGKENFLVGILAMQYNAPTSGSSHMCRSAATALAA